MPESTPKVIEFILPYHTALAGDIPSPYKATLREAEGERPCAWCTQLIEKGERYYVVEAESGALRERIALKRGVHVDCLPAYREQLRKKLAGEIPSLFGDRQAVRA